MEAIDLIAAARSRTPLLLILLATTFALAAGSDSAQSAGALLGEVRVANGGAPYAGDRSNLVTISPNSDGVRDSARLSFRLTRGARVTLKALVERDRGAPPRVVFADSQTLSAGHHRLAWVPSPQLEPRTYVLRLLVDGAEATRVVVRVLGVDAGFTRPSYHPGERATLAISTDAAAFTVQLFLAGPESGPSIYSGYGNKSMFGVTATRKRELDWSRRTNSPGTIHVRIPDLKSGLYFARIEAHDGRVGFAPFVVVPRALGRHRVAVVFPTNTWEAYNQRDVDGDGTGDTWYSNNAISHVDLTRPYLHRGVPTRLRAYQIGFVRWLYATNKRVDFLSDRQLDWLSARRLHHLYDLVVFLGHHEYVTDHAYDTTAGYRDLGGNLLFTSATNFLYRVERRGRWLVRTRPWRYLGRPEASLIGVQYLSNDDGLNQGHYQVVGAAAAPWAFRGTGLQNGDSFGHGGIEIDARSAASPPQTVVLATMPDLHGPGYSAEMTYYSTRAGVKVFAAGTLNFAGTALEPKVKALLENVWRHLARP